MIYRDLNNFNSIIVFLKINVWINVYKRQLFNWLFFQMGTSCDNDPNTEVLVTCNNIKVFYCFNYHNNCVTFQNIVLAIVHHLFLTCKSQIWFTDIYPSFYRFYYFIFQTITIIEWYQFQDIVSYVVSTGIVDILSDYLCQVRGPLKGNSPTANFVLIILSFLSTLLKMLPLNRLVQILIYYDVLIFNSFIQHSLYLYMIFANNWFFSLIDRNKNIDFPTRQKF